MPRLQAPSTPARRRSGVRARLGVGLLAVVLGAGAASAATNTRGSQPALAGLRATAPAGLLSGPDVSSNNHAAKSSIKWGKIANGGRAFTIVKATGEHGYTNPWFKSDWQGAGQAGLIRAAYHFALPTRKSGDARSQATHFLSVVKGAGGLNNPGTLPLVLDLEQAGGLRPAALQSWVRTFLTTVEHATHRPPLIYTYNYFWQHQMGNATTFTHYPLWIASYTAHAPSPLPGGWTSWTLWQYTANGRLPGVRGVVDLSVFCCSAQALTTLADGRQIPVLRRWIASGGLTGPLGAPIGALTTFADGEEEDFAGGSLYDGPTGMFLLTGAAVTRYRALGGPAGPLGWPTADTSSSDPNGRFAAVAQNAPAVSTFTGGTLVAAGGPFGSLSSAPAYEIAAGPVLDRWNAEGGSTGPLGIPTADLSSVTGGTEVLFTGGAITDSATRGTHELTGAVLTYWLGSGGADSSYGLPSSDVYVTVTGGRADFGSAFIAAAP